MIPKANARGHSFKGVIAYLTHDKDRARTSERVAWYVTGNLPTDDPELAAKLMAWTDLNANFLKTRNGASLAGRKTEAGGVWHTSLAWAVGEDPSKEHQEEAGLEVLRRMELDEHQYIMVGHRDTKHVHMHIVSNLTHPETGKRHELKFEKRVLQDFALGYERKHGIHCHVREENARAYQETGKSTKYRDKKQDYSRAVTRAFQLSDDGKSFIQALKAEGLQLAPARRASGFVIIDQKGDIQKLTRQLEPIDKYRTPITGREKSALIKERLKDIDPETLPDADELSKQIRAELEKAEQEKTQAEEQQTTLKDEFEQAVSPEEQSEPQADLQAEFKASAEETEKEVREINNEDEQNTEKIKQHITTTLEKIAKQAALEVATDRAEAEKTDTAQKEAAPEEKNIEEREAQDPFDDQYDYDRDAAEVARQIALMDAAQKSAENAMSDEQLREQAAQRGLEEMARAEEKEARAEEERYRLLGGQDISEEQKPEQDGQPEELLKDRTQDVIQNWPVPSFASTYKDNDDELFKESRLKERIEQRRLYWKIPKLEREKREADQRLKEHEGWFYRYVQREKYAQIKHAAWAAQKNLDHARWCWRGDIEAIYKDKDQAFINQELIKRGFDVEFAKPIQDIKHEFKSSANDNHPKDEQRKTDNLSMEGRTMDERKKLSEELSSKQREEEKFERLKAEEKERDAEQTLKSTRETMEAENRQKANEWRYDVLDAEIVEEVIEERIEQIVEQRIKEREQNREADSTNDNEIEEKEGLSKAFSETQEEKDYDLFDKLHERQQKRENKQTRTFRR